MAESGRSMDGMGTLASSTLRQVALLVMPSYIGLAALSSAVVRLLYGPSYPACDSRVDAGAGDGDPPKAFYWFPSAALQAADRQGIIFRWMLTSAVLNFGLDFLLIPRFGAARCRNRQRSGAGGGGGYPGRGRGGVCSRCVFRGRRYVWFCSPQWRWASSCTSRCRIYRRFWPSPSDPCWASSRTSALLRLTGAFTMEDLTGLGAFERRLPVRLRSVSRRALEWLAGRAAGSSTRRRTDRCGGRGEKFMSAAAQTIPQVIHGETVTVAAVSRTELDRDRAGMGGGGRS